MPGKGKLNICALPDSWATWEAEKTEDAVSGGGPWPAQAEPVNGSASSEAVGAGTARVLQQPGGEASPVAS